ncbi:MAG TPA: DUF4440 domain-containing protein [Woeseiaceae bacterium]|jgi:uncharacterized protein (TIGR02246 family)|nr:DUF4440 domain-containing protein [Woeseiaceae bacterium]
MKVRAILTTTLLITHLGCTPSAEDSGVADAQSAGHEADVQAILDFEQSVFDAQIMGDFEAWVDSFTDDAIVMAPGEPALISRHAIAQWHAPYFGQNDLHEETDEREVEVFGDWAFIRAHWKWTLTPKSGGEVIESTGNSIWILSRQPDNSWKIARGIYNYDNQTSGEKLMTVDRQAEAQTLMELSREWSKVLASGDLVATLDFWSDDAIVMPPKRPAIEGKMAIAEMIQAGADTPGQKISWEPISAYVSESGDMAYMIERNVEEQLDSDGNKVVTHNKTVTIWRKDSQGQWKNVVDIWNEAPEPVQ